MERLQPVQPVTIFQAVFNQLSTLLAGDTYAPGERLPSERELAEQLQVSRASVREALMALRVLDLVEVRGRATYVKGRGNRRDGGTPTLTLPVADAELLEIQEFREAIESHSAALAAERATADDVAALERALAALAQVGAGDVAAFFAADREFHRTLAQAAGNRLLLLAHAQIHEIELRQPHLRAASLDSVAVAGAIAHTRAAHCQLLKAVRRRDAAGARQVMQTHLAQMRQFIIAGAFDHASADTSNQ